MPMLATAEPLAPAAQLKTKLKEVFGFGQFRGTQEAVIQNIIAGHNTFVIMPTGAGKSLCYQLPALVLPGTAIVISPLIALMKNQVDLRGKCAGVQFDPDQDGDEPREERRGER